MKTCYFCRGPVKHTRIDHMAKNAGRYALVKDLPVEQCGQCGEVYLDAAASKSIDEAVAKAASTREHLNVPVVCCE